MGGLFFDFERISGEIATRYISHTGGHRRGRLSEWAAVQVSTVPKVLRRRDDLCGLRAGVEGADGHMLKKSKRLKESQGGGRGLDLDGTS